MYQRVKNSLKSAGQKLVVRPFLTFFGLLFLLLALMVLGHQLRTPETAEKTAETSPKIVEVFVPGNREVRLPVPAEVKKEQVMTIRALSQGIVLSLNTAPGKRVAAGQTLLEITGDYGS